MNNKDTKLNEESWKTRMYEESYSFPHESSVTYRFTLLHRPDDLSLDIQKYENSFKMTDLMLFTMPKEALERWKEDNAVSVFRKFYQDNKFK